MSEPVILKYQQDGYKIRITKVILSNTTSFEINECINYCNENDFQLTLKQLDGFNDNNNYIILKNRYNNILSNKIVFLDTNDYNLYYMPDNNLYSNFNYKQ